VEAQKQELISQFDYSTLAIFRTIDQFAHGTINNDNLRTFLRGFPCAADLHEDDLSNWIRRFDRDVDGALKFYDFINALQTVTNYKRDKTVVLKETQNESQVGEALNSGNMTMAFEKSEGKGSIIGISKTNQTKSTGFTSNPQGNT